jgi:hypothetical protein
LAKLEGIVGSAFVHMDYGEAIAVLELLPIAHATRDIPSPDARSGDDGPQPPENRGNVVWQLFCRYTLLCFI